ncbi:MAG: suppressor of fused domain protein [Planctomycetaceae bacterium]
MPSDRELYLAHLLNIFGEEDEIHEVDAADGGEPIQIFVYKDIPEEGMITGVTYGLSLVAHPDWTASRPEMIVSVESTHIEWATAAAAFVAEFRGTKAFRFGDLFTTDVPLAPDTKMSGFLVFAQSILDDDYGTVQLSDYPVHFSEFYPIYPEEVAVYERIGFEAFWDHDNFDMYAIARQPVQD